MRLTKTFDLTGVSAATGPTLTAQLSISTEAGYDNVIVEARTAGGKLDDAAGLTAARQDRPGRVRGGLPARGAPGAAKYLTPGAAACNNTGTSGAWNAFTGDSGGWTDVAFDLSAYAGQQVEITISYVTDPATGGIGAFVDDTALVVGGTRTQLDGFEGATSTWTVQGEPEGSPRPSATG